VTQFGGPTYTYGEDGMPLHLPMAFNIDGQGPLNDSDPDIAYWGCWCGKNPCSDLVREQMIEISRLTKIIYDNDDYKSVVEDQDGQAAEA
jgi:hypothetical protein